MSPDMNLHHYYQQHDYHSSSLSLLIVSYIIIIHVLSLSLHNTQNKTQNSINRASNFDIKLRAGKTSSKLFSINFKRPRDINFVNTTFIDVDGDLAASMITNEADENGWPENVITIPRGPRRKKYVFKENEPFTNKYVHASQSLVDFTSASEEANDVDGDSNLSNPVAGNGGSFGRWKIIMQTKTEKKNSNQDGPRNNIVYANDTIDLHWRLMLCHEVLER